MKLPRPPTDVRQARRDTNRHMLWLVLFILVIIGGGLIAITYGASAALVGVGCLLAGAGLIGFLWFVFTLFGKWAGED
jgi:protein-S-isoprenylcysteine O-methyltransferase Ste14